jgi:hypothetical protein
MDKVGMFMICRCGELGRLGNLGTRQQNKRKAPVVNDWSQQSTIKQELSSARQSSLIEGGEGQEEGEGEGEGEVCFKKVNQNPFSTQAPHSLKVSAWLLSASNLGTR